MQYRVNPKNGDQLSALGYGCMRFTRKGGVIDQEKAEREMLYALERGVNYFDTAYTYPGNEVAVGKFLAKGYRNQLYLATKLPQYLAKTYADFDKFFYEELRRLQTDYIDYYLLHMLSDFGSWQRLVGLGIEKWIAEKKTSSEIRNIGFSYHGGASGFIRIIDAFDFDFCQIQFNYLDVHGQAGESGLRYAASKGLPVIIMEPLRGGRLVQDLPAKAKTFWSNAQPKRSPADWGLRWIWDYPEVTVILSGMNDVAQVEENIRVCNESLPGHLSDAERSLYDQATKIIRESTKVACTGCGYCMPCPAGVDIPTCFNALNVRQSDGWFTGLREYIMCTSLKPIPSNASKCIGCGRCEQHCPQGIEIRDMLKAVSRSLEGPAYKVFLAAAKKVAKF
ncbi:MAG: aldo/keto reductase [Clostridia bacterium]|nr:aldo/keto reductase [Clostridia bacterium]